jgi:hypothetical protein
MHHSSDIGRWRVTSHKEPLVTFVQRTTRALVRGASAVVIAAAATGLAAAPAQAGTPDCQLGAMCFWDLNSYDGVVATMTANSGTFYPGAYMQNRTQSVHANGADCARSTYYQGNSQDGYRIWFYSDQWEPSGGITEDPNLSNGGGYGADNGRNFSNNISSYQFSDC